MRICFTGTAKVEGLHLERKHLEALAVEQGHHVDRQLDKQTDLLVLGVFGGLGKKITVTQKYKMAMKLGIKIVSPNEFLQIVGYAP